MMEFVTGLVIGFFIGFVFMFFVMGRLLVKSDEIWKDALRAERNK